MDRDITNLTVEKNILGNDYLPFCNEPWNGGMRVGDRLYPCCYMPAFISGKQDILLELKEKYGFGQHLREDEISSAYEKDGIWKFRKDLIDGKAYRYCGDCKIAKAGYTRVVNTLEKISNYDEIDNNIFLSVMVATPIELPQEAIGLFLGLWLQDEKISNMFPLNSVEDWHKYLMWLFIFGKIYFGTSFSKRHEYYVRKKLTTEKWKSNQIDEEPITNFVYALYIISKENVESISLSDIDNQILFLKWLLSSGKAIVRKYILDNWINDVNNKLICSLEDAESAVNKCLNWNLKEYTKLI